MFDAVSSARSYRPAFSIAESFEIVRQEAGTKIDAGAVQALLTALGRLEQEAPDQFAAMFRVQEEPANV